GSDSEWPENARQILGSLDYDDLLASMRSPEIAPDVLGYFASREELPVAIHEAVITNPSVPPQAVATVARTSKNGGLLELISFNQQLLIRNPEILDALLGNSNRTPEAERRASEIKRE